MKNLVIKALKLLSLTAVFFAFFYLITVTTVQAHNPPPVGGSCPANHNLTGNICLHDVTGDDGGSGGGSSGGSSGVGTITPPAGTVPFATGGNPTTMVAGVVKALISLLIIVAFIIAVIWLIIAGIQFVLGGGDPKAVSAAWSRIYWGLIGLVVVLGSFAIIKIVETVFGVSILSGNLSLPRI